MKKTWKEKMISSLKRIGKKNIFFKYVAMFCITIIVGIHYLSLKIAGNAKKIGSLAMIWLFFVVSSSFSFPGFVEITEINTETVLTTDTISSTGIIDDEMVAQETQIIDDNEVIDGYEDEELDQLDIDLYTVDEILDENRDVTVDSKAESEGVTESQSNLSTLDKNDWKLILINKQHPIPDDYSFTLGTIKGDMKCDERVLNDLLAMLQGAKDDGVNLIICSPYRDYSRQEMLFNRKIKLYIEKGLSYMEAYKVSSMTVTVPGASEHQIGLAVDIVCDHYTSLNAGFGDTDAGIWLAENACDYGFILRYPLGKEEITGIEYEPWHFRYVGQTAATIITEQEITLEELVENLE